jgi:hypothetical protein
MRYYWNYDQLYIRKGLDHTYPVPKEFSTWYELPIGLEEDLRNYQPDGTELSALGWEEFSHILSKALSVAHKSVLPSKPAYHNLRHFVEIVESGQELLHGYEKLTEKHVPDAIKQSFLFALALHDCGHSGCTFRSMAPNPKKLFRPELGVDVSTEYVSFVEADKQAKQVGFNPPARLFICYVIGSSTFGGATPEGKRIGIDHIQPNELFGCMTQAADVCPKSTLSAAVFDDCSVILGENPTDPKPKTPEEMLSTRTGFFNYVESRMNKVDQLAGVALTTYLGWRQNLERIRSSLFDDDIPTIKWAVTNGIFRAVFHSFKE